MINTEQLYLECVIPERNRNAYYKIISGQDLFGFKLIRCWGRIGTQVKIRSQKRFADHEEMNKDCQRILRIRMAHGHTIKEKTYTRPTLSC